MWKESDFAWNKKRLIELLLLLTLGFTFASDHGWDKQNALKDAVEFW